MDEIEIEEECYKCPIGSYIKRSFGPFICDFCKDNEIEKIIFKLRER